MRRGLLAGVMALGLVLSGCSNTDGAATASASSDTEKNMSSEYTQLGDNNHYYYIEKSGLETFLQHGTGILYIGFPECPWCQAYVPQLETVLADQDMNAAYYNLHTDKTEDRSFYDQIAADIESINDTGSTIVQYDNDGKQVIYMPLVLFIKNGRIIAYNDETCTEDSSVISPDDYWTDEKKTALSIELSTLTAEIKTAQQENDAKGCDNGCKVE